MGWLACADAVHLQQLIAKDISGIGLDRQAILFLAALAYFPILEWNVGPEIDEY